MTSELRPPVDDAPLATVHARSAGQMHRSGGDPDRLLIVGNALMLGWGGRSEHASLPGRLADMLSLETRRGLDIDLLVGPDACLAVAAKLVSGRRLWRYDAIVLAFEPASIRQSLASQWRRDLTALLDVVHAQSSSTTQVVLVSMHPEGRRQADRLNAVSEVAADGVARTHLLRLPTDLAADTDLSVGWARSVSSYLLPLLGNSEARVDGSSVTSARYLRDQPDRETDRMRALTTAAIMDTDPEQRFDLIVAEARKLFGTEAAEINFIDDDRQWTKAASGVERGQGAREYSFCNMTIQHAVGMVVPDAREAEIFRENPLVTGDPPIRFYAGFPIESADGYRVGALCVYDSNPRDTADLDVAALRDLALMAQEELRRRTEELARAATPRRARQRSDG